MEVFLNEYATAANMLLGGKADKNAPVWEDMRYKISTGCWNYATPTIVEHLSMMKNLLHPVSFVAEFAIWQLYYENGFTTANCAGDMGHGDEKAGGARLFVPISFVHASPAVRRTLVSAMERLPLD